MQFEILLLVIPEVLLFQTKCGSALHSVLICVSVSFKWRFLNLAPARLADLVLTQTHTGAL